MVPAERHIRRWLEEFVVGMDLCPFARPLLGAPNLRIAIEESAGSNPERLYRAFLQELDTLQSSSEEEIATTLVVFPRSLQSFDDFLDFVAGSDELLDESGLRGHVQIASFHPLYRFAGEPSNAASHFSNRAPYPVLHLLRENMMSRLLADLPDPEAIPAKNVECLNAIGKDELERRWRELFRNQV